MKKLSLLIVLLLFPLWCMAQLKLKGSVQDAIGPLGFANVSLTNSQGDVVTGTVTKEDGTFSLQANAGTYKIQISFLGYTDIIKEVTLDKDIDFGKLILAEDAVSLEEITVVSRKKMIEYKTDRLIFNLENNVSTSGGGALDALRVAPGLVVRNNSISMLGKGSSRVMVDGRMIELTGEELVAFLNSINANDIKNIEIITNPPAKYEAAGDGGIININLKKGATDSWKNSSTLAYDQNTYGSTTLRNNFLYNKDKVKFSFSGSGKVGHSQNKQDLDTYYPTGPWEFRYKGKQKNDPISGRAALDYDLSDRTTIGVQYLGNSSNPDSHDVSRISIKNPVRQLDSLLVNTGNNGIKTSNQTYNAHMITKLDTVGRTLSFDVDYFKFNSKIDNHFVAESFSPEMQFLNTNLAAQNKSNQNINNFSLKADMEHPFAFANISYGAKVSFSKSTGAIQYYNTITGTPTLDPNRSNTFEYKERNQALYINGTKKINDKLSLQLGLRVENTQTEGYSQTLNQANTNNYFKLFPTVYASYTKNENHSFSFNYGKRINRPNFRDLNSFRSYLNSNSYSEGNPFLQPSFTNTFDFTYNYKGKLRTNVFMNVTSNGFGVIFNSNPETNTQIVSRENYFEEYYYGIGEHYTTEITGWWQTQNLVYILGSKNKFDTTINATPTNKIQLYFSSNNTFSLSENTKLQVDYSYGSPYKRGLYEYGTITGLNLAVKQNLMKGNMQVSLLFNDIFNTAYLKDYTSVVNGIQQIYNENNSSRFVRLSLTYSFGNDKVKENKRAFGNDDERNRTN
ncbi:outer membrane beta-barrel family protein [Flavobacterium sp. '19STA2R22 D10 B1']|uniref:outer membrane beta-barrel family protein n=1 Tax=Flavobacterium aerium TaxID=3037261 RepID=UPI00278C4465|nr:outer membrane beta-barrel family protein [Flavobacterium sp. '19STA2R22 D10 B1']